MFKDSGINFLAVVLIGLMVLLLGTDDGAYDGVALATMGLAAFGLAEMLMNQRGILGVFSRPRDYIHAHRKNWFFNEVNQILKCIYCLSVYTAAFIATLWIFLHSVYVEWLILILALRTVQIVLHHAIAELKRPPRQTVIYKTPPASDG